MSEHSIHDQLRAVADELVAGGISMSQASNQFEIQLIYAALERCDNNKTRAASLLGVHRNTLMARIHEHCVDDRKREAQRIRNERDALLRRANRLSRKLRTQRMMR